MSSPKRLLPYLLLILHLQLSYCSESNEEDLGADGSSLIGRIPCSADRDISPCFCSEHGVKETWVDVTCQKMMSFSEVVKALRDKIERRNEIRLVIRFSDLDDLADSKFSDLGQTPIISIRLFGNKMRDTLSTKSFEGIDSVTSLAIIETKVKVFPGTIFEHMPNVEVFTIEHTPVESVSPADFKSLTKLKSLTIKSCNLTYIESDTFPVTLNYIDLHGNNITTLNQTLRNNTLLEWVFLAHNNIESMEGQLADVFPNYKLFLLDLSFNNLTSLPKSFAELYNLDRLYANGNRIRRLNTVMRTKSRLAELDVSQNRIDLLESNEFEKCIKLAVLNLSFNALQSLNGSLTPLESLRQLNLTHNNLTEFSFSELPAALQGGIIDLSNNHLRKFVAFTENGTTEISVVSLHLEFNELETLEGSMARVKDLKSLNISHNKFSTLPVEFLSALKALQELDVSHNLLVTLYDVSKAGLSALQQLYAINNQITDLSQVPDFKAAAACSTSYLQNNKIEKSNANHSEDSQCVPKPRADFVLQIYLDGNEVLCKNNVQETINSVERSRNNTKIVGHCWRVEGQRYNVSLSTTTTTTPTTPPPPPAPPVINNTLVADSKGHITVVTLEH